MWSAIPILVALVLATLDASFAFEHVDVGGYDRRLDRASTRSLSIADALCQGTSPMPGPEANIYRGQIFPSATAACRAKVADLYAETALGVAVRIGRSAWQKRCDRVTDRTGSAAMIDETIKPCR